MASNTFMRVEDVAEELGISKSYAYKIVQQLNAELITDFRNEIHSCVCSQHIFIWTRQHHTYTLILCLLLPEVAED